MSTDQESPCCNSQYVLDNGYMCCRSCGAIKARELDVNHISFLQNVSKLHSVQYTRLGRFSQKIVGSLLQTTNYKPPENMILYLNSCRQRGVCETPEDLLVAIANYKTTVRRPYMHSTTLWSNMVGTPKIPTLGDVDKRFMCLIFEEIFYVWTRLDFERPRLPMGQAIVLIVENFNMGPTAKYLVRFIRILKCAKRRERYSRLFKKCLRHIKHEQHRRRRFENFQLWREWVRGGETGGETDSYEELRGAAQDILSGYGGRHQGDLS
jgi:hypothetical protein